MTPRGDGSGPWRIVDLQLEAPIPDLRAEPGLGGLQLVFWRDDLPLGELRIASGQLPMTAGALRARAAHALTAAVGSRVLASGFAARPGAGGPVTLGHPDLREVLAVDRPLASVRRGRTAPDPVSGERLSVVICTCERPVELARCLASLTASISPPDEIVVVDNAPQGPLARAAVEAVPGVRYVAEPHRGLAIARNTGIRAARGDLVAFTDDDTVVHPTWTARVRDAFSDPALLALTGLVLPAALDTEAQQVFEHELGGFGQGFRTLDFDAEFFRAYRWKGVPVWLIGAGANMAFRRRAFDLVGLFDERLGAGAAGCNEDSELWYRLLAEGQRCRYDPSVIVVHHHRADEAALRRQIRAYMRGHVTALLVQYERHRHAGNLLRLFTILPRYYASVLLSGLLYGFGLRHRLLASELAGCAEGAGYYLRHRRRRSPPPTRVSA